jgi:DNA-binding beta-propeller fold protein YncE
MPNGLKELGSVSSVRVGPDGNVYVFHRCVDDSCAGHDAVNPILVYTPLGRLVRGMSSGKFNWPHGLLVMPDASVWALDAGAVAGLNGQRAIGSQALHIDKNDRIISTLGKPGVSAAGRDTLNKPSDIVIGRNGDIFIADGHSGGAARLVKFNSKGEYVTECGSRGDGPGQMGQPHALAVDSQGRIFLADRTNNRINIYDQDCRFLTEWRQFGRPSWIAIDVKDTIYVVDTQTTDGRAGFENGIYIGNARDGKVAGFIPKIRPLSVWQVRTAGGGAAADSSDATNMESIAVTPDGSAIYGGEVGLKTVIKFVRKP